MNGLVSLLLCRAAKVPVQPLCFCSFDSSQPKQRLMVENVTNHRVLTDSWIQLTHPHLLNDRERKLVSVPYGVANQDHTLDVDR